MADPFATFEWWGASDGVHEPEHREVVLWTMLTAPLKDGEPRCYFDPLREAAESSDSVAELRAAMDRRAAELGIQLIDGPARPLPVLSLSVRRA